LAPVLFKKGLDEDIVHAHGNMWNIMNKAPLAEAGGETFLL